MKKWLKKVLGITALELQVATLNSNNKMLQKNCDALIERNSRLEGLCNSIAEDNRIILNHVKLINKDFSVVADVSYSKYEPSIVLVMKRYQGLQDVVKTYTFKDETLLHIYHLLEGFGKDAVRLDKLKNTSGPNFRY